MLINNAIQYIKYSTVGLIAMTAYLLPESREKCFGIISVMLFNHVVEKISKKIYNKYLLQTERNTNKWYLSFYFHAVIINKLCCMKYISSNIPKINFNNYNYPLNIGYELLNIFWKTYSNIIYVSYVGIIVCCISAYLMYPLVKFFVLNLINNANTSANANIIMNRFYSIYYNSNRNTHLERNMITIEKLDRLCPLRCKKLNNIVIKNSDELDECCICKDKFNYNELHRILPCKHTFHAHCIEDWIIRNKKCPLCRYELQI